MAKSKTSLGKCHIVLENMCYFQISFDIDFEHNSTVITGCMIAIPLDHEIFAPRFISLDVFQCLLVYSLWKLEWNLYPTVV